jgi:hypothetical protein
VRKPPAFTIKPEAMYQRKVGESVDMHCEAQEAEGTQKPTITWQRVSSVSPSYKVVKNPNLKSKLGKINFHLPF